MVDFDSFQESKSRDPSTIIMASFLLFISLVIGYVYIANKNLNTTKSKKYGKKSKKGKENWSYGD